MAGGSGSRKEGGSLDKDRARPCHQRYRNSHRPLAVAPEPSLSECFKRRRKLERQRTYSHSVQKLQQDILRLLYSNLDIKQEEEILVELIKNISNTLVPRDSTEEYPIDPKERKCEDILCSDAELVDRTSENREDGADDLSPSTTSEMGDSGLETGTVSPQENTESENSVTDLEESHCTDYVSMDDDSVKISVNGEIEKSREKRSMPGSSYRTSPSGNARRDIGAVTKSGEAFASNDVNASVAGCSSLKPEGPDSRICRGTVDSTTDERENKLATDDELVAQYENQVLSEPFYESDCGSTENEHANWLVPTESFEFVGPQSSVISPTTSDPRRDAGRYEKLEKTADEKLPLNPEARSMTVEELRHELSHSNDMALKKSSSSISSYYFIDASSLNDELETGVGSLNVANERDDNLPIYVPTRSINAVNAEEQSYKLTARKLSSLQGGHERVAEFERELKMTEYLKPMKEQRRVKRVDSISEDKLDGGSSEKGIEKEALVVEIKEADSGESAHPSPSSDNNRNVKQSREIVAVDDCGKEKNSTSQESDENDEESQGQQQRRRRRRQQRNQEPQEQQQQQQQQQEQQQQQQPPTLIRRNTFELDPNDEKLSTLRQEYERRQGHLLFQNSIPQYSGHRVDGDSCFEPTDESVTGAPVVTELVTKFSVDMPRTGVKYSTITYLTTGENPEISAGLITAGQEVSVKSDVVETKYATTSMFLLGDTKRLSAVGITDDKVAKGSFAAARESPEEMTCWASDREVSARSNVDNQTDAYYAMTKSASDKLLADSCSESEDSSRYCFNSLPVTLNCDTGIRENGRYDTATTKRPKRDETTPIVSGGASTVDYTKPTDSPIVHRKTESTPIVSGGSVIMKQEPHDNRVKTPRMASSMTAWVVDMSDCGKIAPSKSVTSVNCQKVMSQSFSYSDCGNNKSAKKTTKSSEPKHSSLGFFVNLKDMDSPKDSRTSECRATKKSTEAEQGAKQSCEFFIDISGETSGVLKNSNPDIPESNRARESCDKKNIFSMFIDLKEPSERNEEDARRKMCEVESASKLFEKVGEARVLSKLQGGDSGESSSSGQEKNSNGAERGKPSVFMFIESDSPVVRRRALSSSRPGAFQRHSWNVDKSQSQGNGNVHTGKDTLARREHKRAHSVSVDRGDLRKLQTKSSNSSHSLSEVARADTLNGLAPRILNEQESSSRNTDTSTEEVFEYDVRDTPPNSHVEIVQTVDLGRSVKIRDHKEQQQQQQQQLFSTGIAESVEATDVRLYEDECSDVSAWEKTGTESTETHTRKSETFDISSGSGPSPETDNHQELDLDVPNGEMTNYTKIMQTAEHETVNKISETHKSLTETIKMIECELKKPDYRDFEATPSDSATPISRKDTKSSSRDSKEGHMKITCSSFVRLSDLDKAPLRSRASDLASTKDDATRSSASRTLYRMSNSIPETSWVESKLAMNRSNAPMTTLPRKFSSIMSTSLPAKHKSPIEDADCDVEGIISESDQSSMQSSMCRSGADVSTEETETSSMGVSKPYNRLGEDLLRMFLEEINPDVTIDVGGRRIRAHKCILSSRCQYFAAILSGGWIESAGNVISLQGYSYNAVHFALCHIYSGESNIPETLSIVELATLADMLCLEGLKEVIGYTLKVKYCHLFHKPCQVCAVGVLECLPLAAAYGLDEVYRKSLRWITRHFVRIWPCKAFATLPRELMDKCYHQHIVHMSTDNVLQTMMDCDKLLATLPNVRWAEPVFRMVSNLLETAVKFISENFSGVLGNENFQALGRDLTWNISRLEDNFLAAADRLPPDQACKSYSKLNKMLAASQIEESSQGKPPWGPLFVDFLRKIQSRVEKCLVKEASRAARTTTWLKMDLELRRRIQELACLVILPHETSKRPSRHSNFIKEPRAPTARSPATRSLDLRRVKMAISQQTDKSRKEVTTLTAATTMSAPNTTQQVKKALLVKPRSDPLERKVTQEEKQSISSDSAALRPKSWPNKLEVKSRYLEPRNKSATKESAQQSHHERVIVQQRRKIMISSSDSSRTSSPAMKRAVEKKLLAKMKLPIKKDTKALSSDSLAEASGSRTTATKKEAVSKSCGITRPESPSLKQKDAAADIALSADSLVAAEPKKKQQQQQQPTAKKKQQQQQQQQQQGNAGKMDTSMSTDSLMAEISATPKSTNASNKVSPTMARVGANKTQAYDRAKKSSPPMQQRSPLTAGRRLPRSLECSTAASRNRAAAISAYHGSPNLRRNLLEAAKTPDVPPRSLNGVITRLNPRQQNAATPPATTATATSATAATAAHATAVGKKEKKEPLSSQPSTESPGRRSSPKSNVANRSNRITSAATKRPTKAANDEKSKNKCHNGDASKNQPTVGSRSGTFLKDEPTILKKPDIKTAQISSS